MRYLLTFFVWALCSSCAHAFDSDKPRALLMSVDVTDGVSKIEASAIAEAYFLMHVGCGAYSGIADGASWNVQGFFGRGASPIKGFTIDKKTGEVKSSVGDSYINPEAMLDKLKKRDPSTINQGQFDAKT